LRKSTGSVRFWFYKPETEKTEPNQNKKKTRKKPSQTEKIEPNWKKSSQIKKTEANRFELVFVQKNRTKLKPVSLNRFRFGFFLISVWLLFYKNRTEPKMITDMIKELISYLKCRSVEVINNPAKPGSIHK